ncbi:hypothetical protein [Lysinibacillus sp. SGAir0095]|uniref:hypothetical protein n=1 Tax=Lysinibacillus sp. SGAir0095 TaxID=2070463 RepID=UPI0010CD2B85|nr:hypothetical protein [Lysinibacillus sp. SGAir0095]QCR33154.1 hypothetical protein C1N55_13615 [Lysinibacillus sp. SGAir0095]
MNEEEFIINQLTLNAFNYHKFGGEQFKQSFEKLMYKLQQLKKFCTIEEACNYFIAKGEKDVEPTR